MANDHSRNQDSPQTTDNRPYDPVKEQERADRTATDARLGREEQAQDGATFAGHDGCAGAEAREREIVGRDRSGPPIAAQPQPHNPYAEYERRWGHEMGGRER